MAEPRGHGKKDLFPASAAQQVRLKVYHRCIERHLRVLNAKIASLEIKLNDELSKKSSSSAGLQEDVVTNNDIPEVSSACSELLDEIQRTSARRDAIYAANQHKINKGDGNGNVPPPPAAGM